MVLGQLDINIEQKGASLMAQTVKNLPAMQETWVQSLSQEDPLEQGRAIHSRQECWSGSPCPSLEDLPNSGIEPMSLTSPAFAGGFFTTRDT